MSMTYVAPTLIEGKARAMINGSFAMFAGAQATPLTATAFVVLGLFAVQVILHPIWAFFGNQLAGMAAGTPQEPYFMVGLAALTLAVVIFVLF